MGHWNDCRGMGRVVGVSYVCAGGGAEASVRPNPDPAPPHQPLLPPAPAPAPPPTCVRVPCAAQVSVCPLNVLTGYTLFVEDEERHAASILTRSDLEARIVVHLAGRCAEKLVMGEGQLTGGWVGVRVGGVGRGGGCVRAHVRVCV